MSKMNRYAVYYAPRPGPFAEAAAAWLGWDGAAGHERAQPDLPDLPRPPAAMTQEPRRYGFHGTIRAPFRPADRIALPDLDNCLGTLAARLAPVVCSQLRVENLHGFLALTPQGCEAALLDFAAQVVEATDHLRAPLTDAEIARRRPETLSVRQRDLLTRWGYPFVMDEFRFHLTLTDRLAADEAAQAEMALSAYFAPVLPQPFVIEDLCLFGEDGGGRFHLLRRYALAG